MILFIFLIKENTYAFGNVSHFVARCDISVPAICTACLIVVNQLSKCIYSNGIFQDIVQQLGIFQDVLQVQQLGIFQDVLEVQQLGIFQDVLQVQ